MTQVTSTGEYADPGQIDNRLIGACNNPRDRAFVALLARSGIRVSEAISLTEENIDFRGAKLTIVHLKEKSRLKCPHCGKEARNTQDTRSNNNHTYRYPLSAPVDTVRGLDKRRWIQYNNTV